MSIVHEQRYTWVQGIATCYDMNCGQPLTTIRIRRRGGGRCATSPQPNTFYSDAFKKLVDKTGKV